MITEKDIEKQIADVMTKAGFNVVAGEVDEGFSKPAVFVTVFPSSAVKLTCGGGTEEITASVEIKYIPAVETVEDCVLAADTIKHLFFYGTFDVKNRRLTVEEISFEVEDNILYASFDLTFIQRTNIEEEYEPMKILELGGNV